MLRGMCSWGYRQGYVRTIQLDTVVKMAKLCYHDHCVDVWLLLAMFLADQIW